MPEYITDIFLLMLMEDPREENSVEEKSDEEYLTRKIKYKTGLAFALEAFQLILGYS